MNANYSEALEQQMALLRWADTRNLGADWRLRGFMRTPLVEADPFFVSPDICAFIERAAIGYPKQALVEDMLPAKSGFVWLDRPLPLPRAPYSDEEPDAVLSRVIGLRAFSWIWGKWGNPYRPGIGLCPWGYVPQMTAPWPLSVFAWDFGQTWHDTTGLDRPAEEGAFLTLAKRYVMTLFSFMQQRIFTVASHAAERHVRRRLERSTPSRSPLVQVVELRRREVLQKQAVEPTEREWSCQWVVRGHWRQQPYPKAGDVRPKWITPYVKGPDDKPLKPPRATVFAVVR